MVLRGVREEVGWVLGGGGKGEEREGRDLGLWAPSQENSVCATGTNEGEK